MINTQHLVKFTRPLFPLLPRKKRLGFWKNIFCRTSCACDTLRLPDPVLTLAACRLRNMSKYSKWCQNEKTIYIYRIPLKFNIEPEKKSLEKEIPFGNHHVQVPAVEFGGSRTKDHHFDNHCGMYSRLLFHGANLTNDIVMVISKVFQQKPLTKKRSQ